MKIKIAGICCFTVFLIPDTCNRKRLIEVILNSIQYHNIVKQKVVKLVNRGQRNPVTG